MLGWGSEQLIGQSIWDFQTDNKCKQELRDYLNYLVAEQPSPEPYITTNLTKDGREVSPEVIWD